MSTMISPEFTGGVVNCWQEGLFEQQNVHQLVDQQLARVDVHGEFDGIPKQFGIVIIDGKNPASTLGREVEKVVFWEHFKNDLDCLREEYEPYDTDSVFIVAIDVAKRQPAGVIRMIPPQEGARNKSVDDIANPKYPWGIPYEQLQARSLDGEIDLSKTIDVATLALKKEYRQKDAKSLDKLSSYMYYAMYQWSRAHDLPNWIGIIDTRALPGIQQLGKPLDLFYGVEPKPYIDSPSSIPFYANLDRIDSRIEPIGIGGFFIRGEGHDKDIAFDLREQ